MQVFNDKELQLRQIEAQQRWELTEAWREFEEKCTGRSADAQKDLGEQLMDIFAQLGKLRDQAPGSEAVQQTIAQLQQFITDHYYTCTKEIQRELGEMYAAGDVMTDNIDTAGGPGTAALARDAIEIYCGK